MSTSAEKIRAYYDLRPTNYPVVHSIRLFQEIGSAGACEQALSIVLQKEFGSVEKCLCLDFLGVRELSLHQPQWSLISIAHLEITLAAKPIASGGTLLVSDADQDQIIRFLCRDFAAQIR